MHTTNTADLILRFIRFYIPCLSTLVMKEYETLGCVCVYHEYQSLDGTFQMVAVREALGCEWERPRNSTDPYSVVVKKDGIAVGKITWQILKMFDVFNNPCEKFMCLIFSLTEP